MTVLNPGGAIGKMRKPHKTLVRWAVLGVCIAGFSFAFFAYRTMDATLRNSYAVWWVADMVTVHLAANHGSWPHSWDDLRDDYETCVKHSGRPWTFEELSRRVIVDWNVDTKTLEQAITDGTNFRVIWLRDGMTCSWERREPNQIVRNYLRSRMNVQPADALAPMNLR